MPLSQSLILEHAGFQKRPSDSTTTLRYCNYWYWRCKYLTHHLSEWLLDSRIRNPNSPPLSQIRRHARARGRHRQDRRRPDREAHDAGPHRGRSRGRDLGRLPELGFGSRQTCIGIKRGRFPKEPPSSFCEPQPEAGFCHCERRATTFSALGLRVK